MRVLYAIGRRRIYFSSKLSLQLYTESKIVRGFVMENKVHEKTNDNHCQPSSTGPEMVDLRKKLKSLIDTNTTFCSFELTRVKDTNIYQRFFAEMNKYRPLFYALTYHLNKEMKGCSSSDIFKIFPKNTLLHLIANDLTSADVEIILRKALDDGITNIFVLRGDSPSTNNDFPYAVDMVRFIRKHFGDKFCICVAGYPDMHPESSSKKMDLYYLKEKVDAGADFIITQIFFEPSIFIKFVNDCKDVGINVPIIPGIFPIPSYTYLVKMARICNVRVPQIILDTLQQIKDNDDEVHNYGLDLSINMIKEIRASKVTCGFHLFTFNRTSLSSEICNKLGILPD